MRFDDLAKILASMIKPVGYSDVWSDERDIAEMEGYNKALEDVAKRLKLELEREQARPKPMRNVENED